MKQPKIISLLLLMAGMLLTIACGGDDPDDPITGGSGSEQGQTLTVGTPTFTDIEHFSVQIHVNVAGDGILEKGFYYSVKQDPKEDGEKVTVNTLSNVFAVTVAGLQPGTTYYVQAFVTDKNETKLSSIQSFTTLEVSPTPSGSKLVGGDISLLTRYEDNGAIYVDRDGNNIKQRYGNMLTFLKQQGLNAMRVRLFVDPTKASDKEKGEGVCQDLDYVKALGKRIKDAGMKFMLDFHYSDTWADPAKQWTPTAWQSLSNDQLYTKIYDYTKDCLTQLKAAGAEPDLIQTGNEISYGMLWGKEGSTGNRCYSGNTDNWERFTTLLRQAGKACREVCPSAKIVLHTERIAKQDVLRNFYDNMAQYNVDYDVIGLSYYPYYHGKLEDMDAALTMLESRFSTKEIMLVETGYYHKWQPEGVTYDYSQYFAINQVGQESFTTALIVILNNRHPKVTGLFWWWLEANEFGLDWNSKRVTDSWYNAGLFDNETGKALPALYQLKTFQ